MAHSLNERPGERARSVGIVGKLLRPLIHAVQEDVKAWRLTPGQALMIALAPVAATIALVASTSSPRLFRWLIDEDMVVENLQLVLLALTVVLSGRLSARLVKARPGLGFLYGLATLGCFLIIGEEISWAQRIFGLRTPAAIEAINAQREISVHNLYGFHAPTVYTVMLAGIYGAVMPLVRLALPASRRRSLVTDLFIPPLCLVPAFLVPACYRLWRFIFKPELHVVRGYEKFVITEFSELGELCLYFGVAVFVWLNLRLPRPELR